MQIVTRNRPKSKDLVYVQLRQVLRSKNGKPHVTRTKAITVYDATIDKVLDALNRAIPSED